MEKFEDKLFNLKIPEITDKYLEYDLKEKLEKKFFYNKFKIPYRIAFSSALAMFFLAISFVVNPNIANKINYVIRGVPVQEQTNNNQQVAESHNKTESQEFKGFEGLGQLASQNDQNTDSQLATVAYEDGEIKTIKYLNPDDFEEGKIYMIRKYKSQDKQGVIMINEIQNQSSSKGVIRKM